MAACRQSRATLQDVRKRGSEQRASFFHAHQAFHTWRGCPARDANAKPSALPFSAPSADHTRKARYKDSTPSPYYEYVSSHRRVLQTV
jgi:hypothetical protein